MGRFRFLEELALADCAIDLEGATLEDVFATAARALAEVMVDPATLPATIERRVTLQAEAHDLLLFDWIAELILRKDRDGEVFPSARVRIAGDGPFRLDAVLHGGRLDPEHTALRNDPKAVTLHAFVLERTGSGWHARVVIDI